jgi:hypothetical protein
MASLTTFVMRVVRVVRVVLSAATRYAGVL